MADALRKGCDNIITCGGIQSNHSRATAVAAAQLGLKPHLVLRATVPTVCIEVLHSCSIQVHVAALFACLIFQADLEAD